MQHGSVESVSLEAPGGLWAPWPNPPSLADRDIGGYTKFMKLHRISLAPCGGLTNRLLSTLVDYSPLPLIEIEGDAVFFCAPLAQVDANAMVSSLAMHQAFHTQLERMIALRMCNCDACMQSRNLKVKFVGHVGEVAKQTIRGRETSSAWM